MSEKVLFVDDEPNVLAGLERQLRKRYAVRTAPSGEAGLAALDSDGPFAVVVSDMRMPGMNGAEFLAEVRARQPDAVRVLLTGYAEVQSAIDAVNHSGLFRFLTKPCSAGDLSAALDGALEQHRLVTAERDVLDRTLRGCVQVLGEVLALVNPTAFDRALRVQRLARELAAGAGAAIEWDTDVAAILSHLGTVGVSARVLALADRGADLSPEDRAELDAAPKLALDLIRRIPRLERVVEIVGHVDAVTGGPLGSKLLRLARDFDVLLSRGQPPEAALGQLRANRDRYDTTLLDGLARHVHQGARLVCREVAVADLQPGMVLEADLRSSAGVYLLRQGSQITAPLALRLVFLAQTQQIPMAVRVLVPLDCAGK